MLNNVNHFSVQARGLPPFLGSESLGIPLAKSGSARRTGPGGPMRTRGSAPPAPWQSRVVHSVLTGSVSPVLKADFSVCHAKVAHLTRAGESRTPQKTTSLPRSWLTAESVVSNSWNLSSSLSASARVLPLRLSVISDAEAVEMAHPEPSKLTSTTISFSTLT